MTELVTGLDLVELQLHVAEGGALDASVTQATTSGHAIEARLYAEDPDDGFLPDSGRLERFEIDAGAGVRVDAGYATGSTVSTSYDAMLAKVIAWGPSRDVAARRLRAALRGARLHGVRTNRDLLVGLLGEEEFLDGRTDTGYLDRHPPIELTALARDADEARACVLAALWQRLEGRAPSPQPRGIPAAWRNVGPADQPRTYLLRGVPHVVEISGPHGRRRVSLDGEPVTFAAVEVEGTRIAGEFDGRFVRADVHAVGDVRYLDGTLGTVALTEVPRLRPPELEEAPGSMHAPLPGAVHRVTVSVGAEVAAGDVLMVLEAMKMEHAIRAPLDGRVAEVLVGDGDQVDAGEVLVVVTPREDHAA